MTSASIKGEFFNRISPLLTQPGRGQGAPRRPASARLSPRSGAIAAFAPSTEFGISLRHKVPRATGCAPTRRSGTGLTMRSGRLLTLSLKQAFNSFKCSNSRRRPAMSPFRNCRTSDVRTRSIEANRIGQLQCNMKSGRSCRPQRFTRLTLSALRPRAGLRSSV